MAIAASTGSTVHPHMSQLGGYSDFFASGFRAVSTRVRSRRPASFYSSSPTSSTELDSSSPVVVPEAFKAVPQHRQRRRPLSMIVTGTQQPSSSSIEPGRGIFASFSNRLFDRMPFISSDSPSSASLPRKSRNRLSSYLLGASSNTESKARSDVWTLTNGGPSAPNGGPDTTGQHFPLDPFDSSSDSKSFFVDLSDSSPNSTPAAKRDSFLSMSTTNSTPPRSLLFPRRERPISIQTMPLPSRSRTSSFQLYRHPAQEKSDFWILEEEPDVLLQPLVDSDYEARDDAAGIDWRQFHNDLLNVEG
ncbi:hypothetical protein FA15DRAFT_672539 [Coprinopsis marcescibilis]|uniref:Uncharacterized protein n=1 Tax=Coprinopsis marcescibilis TaxID=230819 RepID=A0A5C3KM53_COPMA|nr:hypothetical protein FA15DRAFT_672539 [Coprinopsis marcescibilis]